MQMQLVRAEQSNSVLDITLKPRLSFRLWFSLRNASFVSVFYTQFLTVCVSVSLTLSSSYSVCVSLTLFYAYLLTCASAVSIVHRYSGVSGHRQYPPISSLILLPLASHFLCSHFSSLPFYIETYRERHTQSPSKVSS